MLDRNFLIYLLIFLSTLFITATLEKMLIPRLSGKAKQPIYTGGPSWHIKKSGTPTMGGLAFLIATAITLTIFAFTFSARIALSVIISLLFAISNSLIGIFDDLKKLRRKKNAGLSPRQKLLLQSLTCILFLSARAMIFNDEKSIAFSFGSIDLGVFFYPLALFFLLGLINSANLTDGVDGLASSVAFSIGVSLFYVSTSLSAETAIISASIIGASLGFLLFNAHPAKIFMGDTGSLFFGALIASTAFTIGNPIIIIIVSGVYLFEGFSVILQVSYFKLTRKRIFKMAPFHHHLEKCGWDENKICIYAILSTFVLSILAYIFCLA